MIIVIELIYLFIVAGSLSSAEFSNVVELPDFANKKILSLIYSKNLEDEVNNYNETAKQLKAGDKIEINVSESGISFSEQKNKNLRIDEENKEEILLDSLGYDDIIKKVITNDSEEEEYITTPLTPRKLLKNRAERLEGETEKLEILIDNYCYYFHDSLRWKLAEFSARDGINYCQRLGYNSYDDLFQELERLERTDLFYYQNEIKGLITELYRLANEQAVTDLAGSDESKKVSQADSAKAKVIEYLPIFLMSEDEIRRHIQAKEDLIANQSDLFFQWNYELIVSTQDDFGVSAEKLRNSLYNNGEIVANSVNAEGNEEAENHEQALKNYLLAKQPNGIDNDEQVDDKKLEERQLLTLKNLIGFSAQHKIKTKLPEIFDEKDQKIFGKLNKYKNALEALEGNGVKPQDIERYKDAYEIAKATGLLDGIIDERGVPYWSYAEALRKAKAFKEAGGNVQTDLGKIITDLSLRTSQEQENVLEAVITEIKKKITPPSELQTEFDLLKEKLNSEITIKNNSKKLNYLLGTLTIGSLLILTWMFVKPTKSRLPKIDKEEKL